MYKRAIHIYKRIVGTDDILTKRCRDHMEYMQRKRDGEELLDDVPPPYIYPRGAKIDELQRLERDDHGEEEVNAKEVMLDEIAGLSSFVSYYIS